MKPKQTHKVENRLVVAKRAGEVEEGRVGSLGVAGANRSLLNG